MMTIKTCGTCDKAKTTEEFYRDKNAPDGWNYSCKACRSEVTKKYRRIHGPRLNQAARKRYVRNREKEIIRNAAYNRVHREQINSTRRVLSYGIPVAEYDAMTKAQNGVCAICSQPETVRHRSGKLRTLSLDHDHNTGALRELLCGKCNKALGGFGDSQEVLGRALAYLKKHAENPEPKIIPFKKVA